MAHEINKQLIDELIAVAYDHRKFDRVKTHELCVGADKELEELERLAKLGAAYLKWCELTGKMHRVGDNVVIPFEEELLEWAEGGE
jgi:hypothetical protein